MERDRIGNPHRLPLSAHNFRTIVCKRAAFSAHSSVLEAHGLLLALRWACRCATWHHSKIAILIDAKAILCAAAK
eukprot:8646914-Karenia_brevis.AAC.1